MNALRYTGVLLLTLSAVLAADDKVEQPINETQKRLVKVFRRHVSRDRIAQAKTVLKLLDPVSSEELLLAVSRFKPDASLIEEMVQRGAPVTPEILAKAAKSGKALMETLITTSSTLNTQPAMKKLADAYPWKDSTRETVRLLTEYGDKTDVLSTIVREYSPDFKKDLQIFIDRGDDIEKSDALFHVVHPDMFVALVEAGAKPERMLKKGDYKIQFYDQLPDMFFASLSKSSEKNRGRFSSEVSSILDDTITKMGEVREREEGDVDDPGASIHRLFHYLESTEHAGSQRLAYLLQHPALKLEPLRDARGRAPLHYLVRSRCGMSDIPEMNRCLRNVRLLFARSDLNLFRKARVRSAWNYRQWDEEYPINTIARDLRQRIEWKEGKKDEEPTLVHSYIRHYRYLFTAADLMAKKILSKRAIDSEEKNQAVWKAIKEFEAIPKHVLDKRIGDWNINLELNRSTRDTLVEAAVRYDVKDKGYTEEEFKDVLEALLYDC